VERDKPKKIRIGWTNFAAIAMETKKRGLKKQSYTAQLHMAYDIPTRFHKV
jgi:hypothetical protein